MADRLHVSQAPSTLAAHDLLAIAAAGEDAPTFYWEEPSEALAVLGLGTAWETRASGSGRFTEASLSVIAALRAGAPSSDRRFGPFVVGGFGFSDADCREHEWREFPSLRLWIPELLWVRRGADCRLTRTWRGGASPGGDDRLRAALASSIRPAVAAAPPTALRRLPTADEKQRWAARVAEVSRRIAANELDKVVLARRRAIDTSEPLDAAGMLAAARSRRPACTNFWIRAARDQLRRLEPRAARDARGRSISLGRARRVGAAQSRPGRRRAARGGVARLREEWSRARSRGRGHACRAHAGRRLARGRRSPRSRAPSRGAAPLDRDLGTACAPRHRARARRSAASHAGRLRRTPRQPRDG